MREVGACTHTRFQKVRAKNQLRNQMQNPDESGMHRHRCVEPGNSTSTSRSAVLCPGCWPSNDPAAPVASRERRRCLPHFPKSHDPGKLRRRDPHTESVFVLDESLKPPLGSRFSLSQSRLIHGCRSDSCPIRGPAVQLPTCGIPRQVASR